MKILNIKLVTLESESQQDTDTIMMIAILAKEVLHNKKDNSPSICRDEITLRKDRIEKTIDNILKQD